jgi:hypothetical protein
LSLQINGHNSPLTGKLFLKSKHNATLYAKSMKHNVLKHNVKSKREVNENNKEVEVSILLI